LWLIEDTKIFNQIRIKLSENRLFRLKYPEVAKMLDKTWKLFISFLEYANAQKILEPESKSIVANNEEQVPTIDVAPEWIKFDGSNYDSFESTFPAYCYINGKVVEGKSWAAIVVEVIENEIANHNHLCKKLYTISLMPNRAERPFFFTEKIEGQNCAKLSNGYWVNLNYSIPRLIKLLELLIDFFGYAKESILMYGVPKHQETNSIPKSPVVEEKSSKTSIKYFRTDNDKELGEKYYKSAQKFDQLSCMDEMEKMLIETIQNHKK
jgi:hypothetical protein